MTYTIDITPEEYKNILYKAIEDKLVPSLNENGMCAYRGKNGTKCAVGLLIPDEEYDKSIESNSIRDLIIQEKIKAANDQLEQLLYDVQKTHDNLAVYIGNTITEEEFYKEFKKKIDEIFEKYLN